MWSQKVRGGIVVISGRIVVISGQTVETVTAYLWVVALNLRIVDMSLTSVMTFIYCKYDRDSAFSSSYVNMIGPLAKNRHSFKFVQNRSKIFW